MAKERDLNEIAKIEKAIKDKYGTEAIQNPKGSWSEEKEKRYQNYKNIFKDFTNHHHKLLLENFDFSLDYLNKRGIGKETILEFQIGYVPSNSDYYSYLIKNYSEKNISETGLFYNNEPEPYFLA